MYKSIDEIKITSKNEHENKYSMFLNMIMSIKQQFSECNSIELTKWDKSKN